MLYGYPIPHIYAEEGENSVLNILDGKQRLSTTISFIEGEFVLSANTPDLNGIQIAGKRFNELSEELQDEIYSYNFSIVKLKGMTETERDDVFRRLNEGVALSKIEINRCIASSTTINFVREIANTEFFRDKVNYTASAINRFQNEENILQTLILIAGRDSGFSGKEIQEFAIELKQNPLCDEIKNEVRQTCEYLNNVFTEKEKFLRKIHIPTLFKVAINAQEKGINADQFKTWVYNFFNSLKSGSAYSNACQSGSAKKDSIDKRLNILSASFMEYVNTLQPVVKEKVIENIEVKETEEQPTEQNTNENEVTENKEVAIE
jgi:hypothetical protein